MSSAQLVIYCAAPRSEVALSAIREFPQGLAS